ncbi:hypothetical protein B0T16DRAFT_453278 [Cercophora newfieldiana]|uniref:Fork-head domain-containing protein n=1 Tax=Cercophora newfieldiana TaxID=92897 RepID=A0AA39YSK8_9PEZI|nr:hypothetical protein B0T16DRAFT_453278 [Cercophora newfieldiana]
MEPEFSLAVERTTQSTSHPTSTNFYACQGGSQYDMAPEGQQASFDNYALHNSPTGVVFPSQVCSSRTSPRSSWGSPDQLRSLSWGQASNSGHFSRQSQQQYTYMPSATSYPTTGVYTPGHSFDSSESGFHLQQDGQFSVCQTAPYPMAIPDGLLVVGSDLSRPLSACSSPFGGLKVDTDLASPTPGSEPGDDGMEVDQYPREVTSRRHCPSPSSSAVDNPTRKTNVSSNKQEEPYAQLIYRAFMSTPRHAMTLQDLYQWFRENTDKGKDDNKGWQNSIRHNLSMNKAFTKRERRRSGVFDTDEADGGGRICLSSDAGVSDNKNAKSTEWYLEPFFAERGVESTTRYRTKNTSRKDNRHGSNYSRGRESHVHHSKMGSHPSGSGSPSLANGGSKKHNHGQMVAGSNRLRSSRHHSHSHNVSSMQALMQHYPGMAAGHPQIHAAHHTLTSTIDDAAAYTYPDYSGHPTMYAADYAQPHAYTQSESGVDEPMTPEPAYNNDLMIPDLHRVAAPSSSNGAYEVDAGYPYPHTVATTGGVGVEVYDEVVDRYSGWPQGPTTSSYHSQY